MRMESEQQHHINIHQGTNQQQSSNILATLDSGVTSVKLRLFTILVGIKYLKCVPNCILSFSYRLVWPRLHLELEWHLLNLIKPPTSFRPQSPQNTTPIKGIANTYLKRQLQTEVDHESHDSHQKVCKSQVQPFLRCFLYLFLANAH